MSAICGIFYKNKNTIVAPIFQSMLASMPDLGLDRSNMWYKDNIGLGHQMTHTNIESFSEELPFYSSEYKIALTTNARIDNRSELCNILNLPSSINDSQLILKAYINYGDNLANHLLGDYALAIWNEATQTLICISDIMNCRPIYYFNNSELFAFASEIRALHTIPQIKRELNYIKIAKFVNLNTVLCKDDTSTYFNNINYLPGNTCLKITPMSFSQTNYWQPNLEYELKLSNEVEYVEAFQEILNKAVSDRLRSAYPVGIMLSGGLDSSALCVAASNLLEHQSLITKSNHTLEAFYYGLSNDYKGTARDEREYVELLTRPNLNINYLSNLNNGPFDNLSELLNKVESPNYISQQYIHRLMANLMQQKNVRVVLDGVYGEMGPSFNGDGYFSDLFRQGKWHTLLKETYKNAQIDNRNWIKLLLSNILPPFITSQINQNFNRKTRERNKYSGLLLNKEFIAEHAKTILNSQPIKIKSKGIALHRHNQYDAMLLKQKMYPIYSYIEKTGIELVHPYLDRRILEFCLSLPGKMKINNGYKRYTIRRSMEGIMPDLICKRTSKSAFIPDYLDHYTKTLSCAYQILEEISVNPLVREVLDLEALKKMLPNSDFNGALMGGQNVLSFFIIPMTLGLGVFINNFKENVTI